MNISRPEGHQSMTDQQLNLVLQHPGDYADHYKTQMVSPMNKMNQMTSYQDGEVNSFNDADGDKNATQQIPSLQDDII